jgi:outer membrane lipoprotein SlyB
VKKSVAFLGVPITDNTQPLREDKGSMMYRRFVMVVTAGLVLAACQGGYAGSRYTPVIDVYGSPGKDPATYYTDLGICQQLAEQRPQTREAARGAGVGAVIGAAGGAIGGAIAGRPGVGAGLGAAAGALAGGAGSGLRGNVNRQDIVINCMRNRGWSVLAR